MGFFRILFMRYNLVPRVHSIPLSKKNSFLREEEREPWERVCMRYDVIDVCVFLPIQGSNVSLIYYC